MEEEKRLQNAEPFLLLCQLTMLLNPLGAKQTMFRDGMKRADSVRRCIIYSTCLRKDQMKRPVNGKPTTTITASGLQPTVNERISRVCSSRQWLYVNNYCLLRHTKVLGKVFFKQTSHTPVLQLNNLRPHLSPITSL